MRPLRRQNGFVLMVIVILLGAMGIAIAIWAAQTKDLMIQTKLYTVHAELDNTIASAAQWVRVNHHTLKDAAEGQWTPLDCGMECRYRVVDANADSTDVEITAVGTFRSHSVTKTVRLPF